MATTYSFGGKRLDSGKRPPIQENDRAFSCGFGTCEIGEPSKSYNNLDQRDLYNLDFTLFNIDSLRDNLNTVSAQVKLVYEDIIEWFRSLEAEFEMKVRSGEIDMNITLFNKLNLVIPKFALAKKVMDSWYSDYMNMVSILSDLLSEYSMAALKIEAMNTQNTSVGGIKESVITLAKQNLSKSKAIQRTISKILNLDGKIRAAIQDLTFKLSEIESGILRYGAANDKKIFNLNDMANTIKSLSEGDSPLVRIQTQLSSIINNKPINFSLTTRPPKLLPPVKYTPNDISTMTPEIAIEKLKTLRSTTLYTSVTRPNIDAVIDYIETKFKNDINVAVLARYINEIKTLNVPNVFLDSLRGKAVDKTDIFITIDTIERTMRQLSGPDIIYKEPLESILKTAQETAKNSVGIVTSMES